MPPRELIRDLLRRRWRVTDAAAFDLVDRVLDAAEQGHSCITCADPLALRQAGVLGDATRPGLLHWQDGRLALTRLARAEERVAAAITRLLRCPPSEVPPPDLPGLEAEQVQAVITAQRHRFSVITGGPGTGKTFIVATVLDRLLRAQPGLVVRLAAPTGRAAAQLRQYLGTSPLAEATSTLHRLLGIHPRDGRPRHHAGHPLVCDVLVIDEVSMVDVELMALVVEALPAEARLILLGDAHQLASVEAGYVLGDLARLARTPGHPLVGHVTALRRSRRFHADRGIGRLAVAVHQGDVPAVLALPEVVPPEGAGRVDREQAVGLAVAAWAGLSQAEPAQALAAFDRARILCAVRHGPEGVAACNHAVERRLAVPPAGPDGHYHGRPLLITANDPDTGLANGDTGVVLRDVDGRLRAWFAAGDTVRSLAVAQLPPHETAWAMTIHKAQGCGFDLAVVVLPGVDAPILSRQLLYTAITRARTQVAVCASDAVLAAAVERSAARASGFAARLASFS